MIPYSRQCIDETDIEAVSEVLRSDFLTQGRCTVQFERAVAERVGAKYVFAANSATSCLHMACLALGIGNGDRVWTSPITFVASATCALMCGASVDFVDVDLDTANISVSALESKLADAMSTGTLPKALIVVHFAGRPCDMRKISELTQKYGVKVIEDASHALGAEYESLPIGSNQYSDITVFSLHAVKIITTGEGGLITTNNEALAEKIASYRSHGVTRDSEKYINNNDGGWYYEQHDLGYNYRMTDIQSALGLSQLKKLDKFYHHRIEIVERYFQHLKDLDVILPPIVTGGTSSWHLFVINFPGPDSSSIRKSVFNAMRDQGVAVNVHYIPVYKQPYFRSLGFEYGFCPVAEKYYDSALSLPVYPGMKKEEQLEVINKLSRAIACTA